MMVAARVLPQVVIDVADRVAAHHERTAGARPNTGAGGARGAEHGHRKPVDTLIEQFDFAAGRIVRRNMEPENMVLARRHSPAGVRPPVKVIAPAVDHHAALLEPHRLVDPLFHQGAAIVRAALRADAHVDDAGPSPGSGKDEVERFENGRRIAQIAAPQNLRGARQLHTDQVGLGATPLIPPPMPFPAAISSTCAPWDPSHEPAASASSESAGS